VENGPWGWCVLGVRNLRTSPGTGRYLQRCEGWGVNGSRGQYRYLRNEGAGEIHGGGPREEEAREMTWVGARTKQAYVRTQGTVGIPTDRGGDSEMEASAKR
jgi:hypothetical protein